MIQLKCPHCGERNVQEFRYGGEYNSRPKEPMMATNEEWTNYLFMRANKSGEQREWWYHRSGCQTWFLAERNTHTNIVSDSYLWE
jgi:heterotetrameric sarcosine oxidase delta subunit